MKRFIVVSCLGLCACAPVYQAPTPAPAMVSVPSYAMQPPAYKNDTTALQQKELEIFEKEKALITAQNELYKREKMLANKEVEFVNKSKALSYKEISIQEQEKNLQQQISSSQPKIQTQTREVIVYREPTPIQRTNYIPTYAPQEQTVSAQNTPMENVEPLSEQLIQDPWVQASSEPEEYTPETANIILQHPIQRDLIRCPAVDDVCIQAYERLGYVRSKNLSRFTAEDETISENNYPAGKWRKDNTIPRW